MSTPFQRWIWMVLIDPIQNEQKHWNHCLRKTETHIRQLWLKPCNNNPIHIHLLIKTQKTSLKPHVQPTWNIWTVVQEIRSPLMENFLDVQENGRKLRKQLKQYNRDWIWLNLTSMVPVPMWCPVSHSLFTRFPHVIDVALKIADK